MSLNFLFFFPEVELVEFHIAFMWIIWPFALSNDTVKNLEMSLHQKLPNNFCDLEAEPPKPLIFMHNILYLTKVFPSCCDCLYVLLKRLTVKLRI